MWTLRVVLLQRGRILRGKPVFSPSSGCEGGAANAHQYAVRVASRVGLAIRRGAQAEADAIVERARREASRIDARERRRCEDALRSTERTLAHIASRYETRLYEAESYLVELALAVAERVVLVQQEERFAEIARAYVREGLRRFPSARVAHVRVSPELARVVPLEMLASDDAPRGIDVTFAVDEELGGLDVAVDTAAGGSRLSVRDRIAAALAEVRA
jgi:vacuolar-type H+-ATPase subunit E/Vma4